MLQTEARNGTRRRPVLIDYQSDFRAYDRNLLRSANPKFHLRARRIENLYFDFVSNKKRLTGFPPDYEHAVAPIAARGE